MNRHKKAYIFISTIYVMIICLILAVETFSFSKLSDFQGNLMEQKYRLSKLEEEKRNLELLDKRFEKIEPELTKIATALPDEKESSKLLSDLDSLAVESGLKLTLVQSMTFGKKAATTQDASLLQTTKGKYGYELPLDIKITGPYQNLTSFIKRLEEYQRLINVNSVEINKSDDPNTAPDQIEAKLKITAYLKK